MNLTNHQTDNTKNKSLVESFKSLGGEGKLVEQSENNTEFKSKFELLEFQPPSNDEILTFLTQFPDRDNVELSISIEHAETITFGVDLKDIEAKCLILKNQFEAAEKEDVIVARIKIHKNKENLICSIYSLSDLLTFWLKDGLVKSFSKIWNLIHDACYFELIYDDFSIRTETLHFYPIDQKSEIVEESLLQDDKREKIINTRNKVAHFANASEFRFIAEDFKLIHPSQNQKFNELFDKLALVTSLVFLSNFSFFSNDDQIQLQLSGYKLIPKSLNVKDEFSTESLGEYYDIYRWVYSVGDINDRIGLTRNIISLHCCEDNLVNIDKGTFNSIISGFGIYLKENVKQYIEIKNKISEFIQSSSDKAGDIANSIGTSFKTNLWTLTSFFSSVFILGVLSKGKFNEFITTDILLLSYGFFIVSIAFLIGSRKEIDSSIDRFKDNYYSIRGRYKGLLDEKDLTQILDNDKSLLRDVDFINQKKSIYSKLWVKTIIILAISITLIWFVNQYPKIFPKKNNTISIDKTKNMIMKKGEKHTAVKAPKK
jgi:hypothetical protein